MATQDELNTQLSEAMSAILLAIKERSTDDGNPSAVEHYAGAYQKLADAALPRGAEGPNNRVTVLR